MPIMTVWASYWGEYCVANVIMFHTHTHIHIQGSGHDPPHCPPLHPSTVASSRTWWSSGCCGGQTVQRGPWTARHWAQVYAGGEFAMSSCILSFSCPLLLPCLILPCFLNPLVPNCAYMGRPLIIELLLNVILTAILTAYIPCSWAITIHINSPPP